MPLSKDERLFLTRITDMSDPFYSPSNIAALRESIQQAKDGKTVTFSSFEELQDYVQDIAPHR